MNQTTTMQGWTGNMSIGGAVAGAAIALVMTLALGAEAKLTWIVVGTVVGAGYGAIQGVATRG